MEHVVCRQERTKEKGVPVCIHETALMKYYKVLVNGSSCFGGRLRWSLPVERPDGDWEPGAWMEVSGPIDLCRRGLHLTTDPYGPWVIWGMQVYQAEPGEIVAQLRDKVVTRRARLLRPIPHPRWWEEAVRFIELELPSTRWFRPDTNPEPSWLVFEGPTWQAASDASADAVNKVGGDPYEDDHLKQAGSAVQDAATRAGRAVAMQVVGGIAESIAERLATRAARAERARDGSEPTAEAKYAAAFVYLYAVMRGVCIDLPIADEHRSSFEATWNVYRKGFLPSGWINGQRCVYAKTVDGRLVHP